MKTENDSVVDGKLTDEQLGKLSRKYKEIERRINEGTITFQDALDVMQYIIVEGKAPLHLSVIKRIHEIKQIELIVATAPFDPVKFIGEDWAFWKGQKNGNGLNGEEERDKMSAALTVVDFNKTEFLICLEKGENSITGEEKLVRLKKSSSVLFGSTVFMGLWDNYQACENKAESALEKLYQQKGITYIDFFGDILRNPNGDRCVLCLCRDGDGQWRWVYVWLEGGWSRRYFSAVSRQVSAVLST